MSVIGRVFSNFRDFYNEINAATLTGAIDVIVVEQPDGTFTCSPFHVRFGKLGVLRSREKVVDIEINGAPQDIHMKLGDSGEAFFVEETDEAEDVPDPWATSPIPLSEFEELYSAATADKPRRKSIDLTINVEFEPTYQNEANDYTQRRNTGGNERDFTTQKREFLSRQIVLGNIPKPIECSIEDMSVISNLSINNDEEHIFQMDALDEPHSEPIQPKVFTPETVYGGEVLVNNNFTPIVMEEMKEPVESKNGKKRRRKKSVMKKKNQLRKASSASLENTEVLKEQLPTSVETQEAKLSDSSTDKSVMGSDESEDVIESESTPTTRPLNRDPDFHFFSDTELTTANSNNASRPSTPVQSDTEFEFSQRKAENQEVGQSWTWGQLPTQKENNGKEEDEDQNAERNSMLSGMFSFMKQSKRMRHSTKDSEGLYLADLSSGNLDPEVTALYFPRKHNKTSDNDNDCESGNGPSLPQSPNSVEGAKSIDSDFDDAAKDNPHAYLQDISLSLCGWTNPPNPDVFVRHLITFSDLCNNPALLESLDLVIRINGKYYNWKTAIPIIISVLVYQRPLPQSTIEQLCNLHMPEASMVDKLSKPETRGYSWWSWRRSKSSVDATSIPPTNLDASIPIGIQSESKIELGLDTSTPIPSEITEHLSNDVIVETDIKELPKTENDDLHENNFNNNRNQTSHEETGGYSGSQSSEDSDQNRSMERHGIPPKRSDSEEKYRKTLRLSSDQIKSLDLLEGVNEVEFSVTTAYQGTTRCKCHIYRWKFDDKIVISDIDGTITKSDVLGHILPIVGKDWAQNGVAQLFTKIKNNGYKLLYLSARAIGQAKVTREYLRSIKQGDLSLPDGPVLLNPTSLMSAFHREVIEKKPEKFKIQCLSDIRALFPDTNPFYAGYGNRINDVWAYRAVGIPIVRIFTINHKGELKHELTKTFQSSYSNMSYIVDQLFPPLREDANEYSQFVYWRDPVPIIDELPSTSTTK